MRQLMAILVVLCPAAVWADDWQTLTGPMITEALTARVLQYDNGASQNFYADGRTLYKAGAGESWGKWWVSQDGYCSTWPPNETPSCFQVTAFELNIRFTDSEGTVSQGRYIDLN